MLLKRRIMTLAIFILFLGFAGNLYAEAGSAARDLQNTFIGVAKNLKPSVVNIQIEKTEKVMGESDFFGPMSPDDEDGPLGDMFRKFFKRSPHGKKFHGPKNQFKSTAAGSGVIFDSTGIILTNNHVVKGSSQITVKLYDGKEFKAKIIGQDPQSDLAVIKVESSVPLPAAKFPDKLTVEPGQWCMAVGNPFGLEQTVTVGVVSALGRSGLGVSAIEDFIQTDCSINPGNSGGPLVDLDGNVIGINTLIYAAPGSGIGFAIPSPMAKRIATQIISKGSVERPYIGISMREITPELAEHFNLSEQDGAVVLDVTPNTPADKAGLQQMDIIREIEGVKMKTSNDVQKTILAKGVGESVNMKILRNGGEKTIVIKLERMPKSFGLRDPEDISDSPADEGKSESDTSRESKKLGFSYQVLTPELANSLNIDPKKKGLIVTEVEDNSLSEKGGLQSRDVITQVNGNKIAEEIDLLTALRNQEPGKKSSVFVVLRDGNPIFLVIPYENKKKEK